MKLKTKFLDPISSSDVPDGLRRRVLRGDQTIRGQKIFEEFPAMTGPTESDLDFVTREYVDSRLSALARTQSCTFTLTADMIAAKSVEISGSIAEGAILMTKLKVEGSAGFIQACAPSAGAEDKANGFYVRLKADGKFGLIDWIDNAEMWRAMEGEKVTVVYQGWAPAGAVVLCFSHFTEASVIANPFDFYGIVTYPEPDYATTWVPLNATNGYGNQWNRSESEVHFGYGGDPLGV